MHEFSIGERIVEAVLDEMGRLEPPPGRLRGVRIVVGGLHQVVPEFLETAYDVLTRDTPAAGSRMRMDVTPVTVRCTDCGWQGGIELPFFRCRTCGGGAVETLTGNELYLDQLEIEP